MTAPFHIVFLPAFPTEIEAMEWAFDHGLEEVRVWRGPDGLIRGSGKRRPPAATETAP